MKIKIGNTEYKTIKECEKAVREKIKKMYLDNEYIITPQNPNFIFLMDILNNHPENYDKIGVGVDAFILSIEPTFKKGIQIFIKRIDETTEVFSWIICCGGRKITTKSFQLDAMRYAVKSITIDFKNNNDLICAICKVENLEYSKYHTDHKTIPFIEIANNFINKTINMPSQFDRHINPEINGYGYNFKNEDKHIEQQWYDYHLQYSDFQILCKTCNLKKGKKHF